jgi:hypothetical protein
MADRLIPELEARQMAKALLDEFGITAGLKKQFSNQPTDAEELIDRFSRPPQRKGGGFLGR